MSGRATQEPLVNPSQTAAVLQRFGFRPTRSLGQNFLVDANVLNKIVEAAGIGPRDIVLEVGTGIGTLTEALAAKAARVITVEIDKKLVPVVRETLGRFNNVTVRIKDAMDLSAGDAAFEGGAADKVVANLPYGVAAPVILKVFAEMAAVKTMVVMVQREIADRILAKRGTKNYSILTVKLHYFCQARLLTPVSRRVFMPPPNVDSAVILLRRWEKPPVAVEAEKLFALISAGFGQRRKQLVNALAAGLGRPKRDVEAALAEAGLPLKVRAENLTLGDFAALADILGT